MALLLAHLGPSACIPVGRSRSVAPPLAVSRPLRRPHARRSLIGACRAAPPDGEPAPVSVAGVRAGKEGPSTQPSVIYGRLLKLGLPYWRADGGGSQARWRLAGVFALTLGTTGVSVLFNFLGRDFFNALSEKDVERFYGMLAKWLAALFLGIPVFVMRDFFQARLALEWRDWMTRRLTADYLADRAFYRVQAGELVDNPDQRIAADVRAFTDTALGFSTGILNALVDLVSFSGILYTIYPPLFVALLLYSVGGTAVSLRLGRPLVGLNFRQEAREADFRFGLVRVRENAESVAFYGGEASERRLLFERLRALVANASDLIRTERNLQFFTSFYRFLIGILPAAVVAPLYFQGKIEFGVVNQSSSAFNHILNDVSLVVFQFESIAGFSAIIDRLGEFSEVLESGSGSRTAAATGAAAAAAGAAAAGVSSSPEGGSSSGGTGAGISLQDLPPAAGGGLLLSLEGVTLALPDGSATLVRDLSLELREGETLLIVGSSGAGKTSLLRAVAGLWTSGAGAIRRFGTPVSAGSGVGDLFFVPQRPYVVLGTLREQLLYPTWSLAAQDSGGSNGAKPVPDDGQLAAVLRRVRLGGLLRAGEGGLDRLADWGGVLSLGEQQRLAFARVLLSRPRLALMDESTSALDTANEAHLFGCLQADGIAYVSVGHRPTLAQFHSRVLRLTPQQQQQAGSARCGWEVASIEALAEAGSI